MYVLVSGCAFPYAIFHLYLLGKSNKYVPIFSGFRQIIETTSINIMNRSRLYILSWMKTILFTLNHRKYIINYIILWSGLNVNNTCNIRPYFWREFQCPFFFVCRTLTNSLRKERKNFLNHPRSIYMPRNVNIRGWIWWYLTKIQQLGKTVIPK